MNLGNIYLATFGLIVGASFSISVAIASLLRSSRRCSGSLAVATSFVLWGMIGIVSLEKLHQPIFAAWHQRQNDAVPRSGCVTYEPSLTRLFATYRMTRHEFNLWVARHPLHLEAGGNGQLHHDGLRLGFNEPELSFETQVAPNGKQLRVYFKSGTAYVSYNAM